MFTTIIVIFILIAGMQLAVSVKNELEESGRVSSAIYKGVVVFRSRGSGSYANGGKWVREKIGEGVYAYWFKRAAGDVGLVKEYVYNKHLALRGGNNNFRPLNKIPIQLEQSPFSSMSQEEWLREMGLGGVSFSGYRKQVPSLLYNPLSLSTVDAIVNDQERRANILVREMKQAGLTKLTLMDGDGRMVFQVLKASLKASYPIEVEVVELDENINYNHRFLFPRSVNSVQGNIMDHLDDSSRYVYLNFCGLSDMKDEQLVTLSDKMLQAPHRFLLSTSTRGIVESSKGPVSQFYDRLTSGGWVHACDRGLFTTLGFDPKFAPEKYSGNKLPIYSRDYTDNSVTRFGLLKGKKQKINPLNVQSKKRALPPTPSQASTTPYVRILKRARSEEYEDENDSNGSAEAISSLKQTGGVFAAKLGGANFLVAPPTYTQLLGEIRSSLGEIAAEQVKEHFTFIQRITDSDWTNANEFLDAQPKYILSSSDGSINIDVTKTVLDFQNENIMTLIEFDGHTVSIFGKTRSGDPMKLEYTPMSDFDISLTKILLNDVGITDYEKLAQAVKAVKFSQYLVGKVHLAYSAYLVYNTGMQAYATYDETGSILQALKPIGWNIVEVAKNKAVSNAVCTPLVIYASASTGPYAIIVGPATSLVCYAGVSQVISSKNIQKTATHLVNNRNIYFAGSAVILAAAINAAPVGASLAITTGLSLSVPLIGVGLGASLVANYLFF